jgi:ATP-dependent Clp protease protease subunit
MPPKHANFSIHCAGEKAEILLYDVIGQDFFGGISSKMFADEMASAKGAKQIDVRINSPGGSVFEGFTMYSLIKQTGARVNVYIDGLAASIASVIAMAGDSIEISATGTMMIHPPWAVVAGNATDFRKEADLLDKIGGTILDTYASRTGRKRDEFQAMLTEGETWFTAQESLDAKLVDRIGVDKKMAACIRPDLFHYKVPDWVLPKEPETIPFFQTANNRIAKLLKGAKP